MKPVAFEYKSARTLVEASEWLAESDGTAKIMAGGQSLTPMLNLRLARPSVLIDIKRTQGFRDLASDNEFLSVGSGWTHSEIEDGAFEDPTRGFLCHVARGIAYRAIRNRGTIGGSLAHADPAADWVTTMSVLGARIVCQGPDGRKRRIPADVFLEGAFQTKLRTDEILVAIEVPRLSAEARWGYYKVCRKSGEFAHAIGAVVNDPKRGICRIFAGATDGPPKLLPQTAAAWAGQNTSAAQDCLEDELASLLPAQDLAKRRLHATAVRRALEVMSDRSDR